jgi:hypothetical protein
MRVGFQVSSVYVHTHEKSVVRLPIVFHSTKKINKLLSHYDMQLGDDFRQFFCTHFADLE